MSSLRILMPSVTGPDHASGAGSVTRNLVRLLAMPPLSASVEVVTADLPRTRSRHRLRQIRCIAGSATGGLPARVAFSYDDSLRSALQRNVAKADLAVLVGGEMMSVLPLLPQGLPTVLIALNIEHELFSAQAARLARRMPPLAPLLQQEARRLRQWEIDGFQRTGRVLFVSPADAARAQETGWVPEGPVVPPLFFDPAHRFIAANHSLANRPLQVGLLANLYWWPNREGLDWFLRDVFPQVQDCIQLHVFGAGSERLPQSPALSGHGRVDSLDEIWDACDLMIGPQQSGGGVSVKTAEALYHGLPFLATRCSMRGLEIPEDPFVATTDSAAEWIRLLRAGIAHWRGGRVSPLISQIFSGHHHASRIQNLVTAVQTVSYA